MIKITMFAVTATLLAVVSPAFAAPAGAAAQPIDATNVLPKLASKPVRYCIVGQVTGSRLPIKECRSREDWLAQGFDPLVK